MQNFLMTAMGRTPRLPTARSLILFMMIGIAASFSGCGLYVPNMQNFRADQAGQTNYEEADENLIINHIKCEIHAGVQTALYDPRFFPPNPPVTGKSVDWLKDWGAKVTYVLTVDEKSSLNPGVSWKNPLGAISTFQFIGGGIQTSSEAQRKETGAVTYAFADLLKEPPIVRCNDQNGILIHSNLRIAEFISNKIFLTRVPGTTSNNPVSIDSNSKPQVLNAFSDEITFTVMYGGNITPSWTFVRLSVNPTSPLFSVGRSKIQYVTITLGPVQTPSTPTAAANLSPDAQNLDFANLIGHSVASAVTAIVPTVATVTPLTVTP